MNITVVGGAGYVGLTTATCLASLGHKVYCMDIDRQRIAMINKGISVVYEKELGKMLKKAVKERRLVATLDFRAPISRSSLVFICVGTPSKADGSMDLSQLKSAASSVGRSLVNHKEYCVIVVKSTVIPGTTENVIIPIIEKKSHKKSGVGFGVCVNPEFLREGSAVKDFLTPTDQGIVIGELDKKSGDVLYKLYRRVSAQILRTAIRTAEMIKYARNFYLAKDISFANEIANLCQKLGINYMDVRKGLEMDTRIGEGRFLSAGIGFGGSCLPKDLRALSAEAEKVGIQPVMLKATLKVNENQPKVLLRILKQKMGHLEGKRIAVLGLAFKPGTDDIRESKSIVIIEKLLAAGANINAYDPQATEKAKGLLQNRVRYARTAKEALSDADACIISTEWQEFSEPRLYHSLFGKLIFDGRRFLDPSRISKRLIYNAIGYPERSDN